MKPDEAESYHISQFKYLEILMNKYKEHFPNYESF
jgi:hypothetical protein